MPRAETVDMSEAAIGRRLVQMIASHKETEEILQNMPEGIAIVDLAGEVKFMN